MSCTCYNFCLYAYLNDHFRKQFKDVLPCFDVPFFQRARNDAAHQATQPAAAHLHTPSVMPLTSTTKELMTKTGKPGALQGGPASSAAAIRAMLTQNHPSTEPSTKKIMLTDDDLNEAPNNNNKNEPNNNRLPQQSSLGSEPATCVDERPLQAVTVAPGKCPCSTSYPNFQSAQGGSEQPPIGQEKESSGSTSSSKQLIKSLRNKLRFSAENSFEEQAIALNEFTLEEPNNNSLMKSSDQTSLINSVPNLPVSSPTKHSSLQNSSISNDKCNTIFLGESNLTLKMDNV